VDWDGPAREVAEAMSQACGLPLRKIGAEPGSLGSYAGVERQIPTVTIELPRSASQVSHEMLWQRYGQALLVAIRFSRYRAASTRVPTFGGSVELESRHFR
jgi:protein MpaA